jgi:type I restriction enzyme S subunit
MQRAVKGVAVRGINIGDVRAIQLPIPPKEEQEEIVQRAHSLFAITDELELRLARATAQVEKLTQAILAKAFRGELVPTEAELARRAGRAYEPAAELLARLAAQRADAAPPQRPPTQRHRG